MAKLYIVTPLIYVEYMMGNAGRDEAQAGNQDYWERYQ